MDTVGQGAERLTAGPGAAWQPCLLAGSAQAAEPTLIYAAETGGMGPVIRQQTSGGDVLDIVVGSEPACAPAGRRVAFVASVDGVSQVLAVQPKGGMPQALTAEETYAGQPAWSPDGTQVAYVAGRDNNWDIWIAPSLGTAGMNRQFARRLTDDPADDYAPSWSPDGSRLAFVSNRGGSHQVYVVQADGTGVAALTSLPMGAEAPAWSPDGFWLAFVAYTGDGKGVNAREIYIMRADGRHPVRLTYNSYDDTDVTWAAAP
jgi:TolB protein